MIVPHQAASVKAKLRKAMKMMNIALQYSTISDDVVYVQYTGGSADCYRTTAVPVKLPSIPKTQGQQDTS